MKGCMYGIKGGLRLSQGKERMMIMFFPKPITFLLTFPQRPDFTFASP